MQNAAFYLDYFESVSISYQCTLILPVRMRRTYFRSTFTPSFKLSGQKRYMHQRSTDDPCYAKSLNGLKAQLYKSRTLPMTIRGFYDGHVVKAYRDQKSML